MINENFDLSRFGRYYRTDIINGYSNFGISLLVMSTMAITVEVFSGLFGLTVKGQWNGAGEIVRLIMFGLFFIITIITAPSKIYGNLTDKKEGTQFLMLPASRLEKFLSMVIICCFVVPLLYIGIYAALDYLVTLVDPTAGISLIDLIGQWRNIAAEIINRIYIENVQIFIEEPQRILNPWLYIDDFLIWPLTFLLGAVFFKKSKISKTIGCYVAFSIVLSFIMSPIMTKGFNFDPETINGMNGIGPEMFEQMFPVPYWTLNHFVLVDTLSDAIWIIVLLWGIWYKLKNLKH